jgi:hypothetical protein
MVRFLFKYFFECRYSLQEFFVGDNDQDTVLSKQTMKYLKFSYEKLSYFFIHKIFNEK